MQQNKNKQEHNHAVKLRIMAEDTEEQLNTDEHTDIKKKITGKEIHLACK